MFACFQANMSQTPLDHYRFMCSEKLCTSRPNFYINWAWELESNQNFKGAEKVSNSEANPSLLV